jgi:hypothetical protein
MGWSRASATDVECDSATTEEEQCRQICPATDAALSLIQYCSWSTF